MAELAEGDVVDISSDDVLEAPPVPRPYAEAMATGAAGPGPEYLESIGLDPAAAGYGGMTVAQLSKLARERGLAHSGNKRELTARLTAADEADHADTGEGGAE